MENFSNIANDMISHIEQVLSDEDKDNVLDIDYINGVLSIGLFDGSVYIINKNEAAQQIWLSSPKSGAWHFSYKEKKWLDSNGGDMYEILSHEFASNLGCYVKFN